MIIREFVTLAIKTLDRKKDECLDLKLKVDTQKPALANFINHNH